MPVVAPQPLPPATPVTDTGGGVAAAAAAVAAAAAQDDRALLVHGAPSMTSADDGGVCAWPRCEGVRGEGS
jgi:hypothetical protein